MAIFGGPHHATIFKKLKYSDPQLGYGKIFCLGIEGVIVSPITQEQCLDVRRF
jgi:hypothetical protein